MLKAEHITVRAGKNPILQDVSFHACSGEWWMVIGPNGAGKSTLLSALSGTVECEGVVTLCSAHLATLSVRRRAQLLSVLSQNSQISDDFTVEQVVAMGRYSRRRGILGTEEPDAEQHVSAALLATGMEQLRARRVRTLSGGERQRTFLAQVFCQDPQVLLLDEPANHLDLIHQKQMFELIDAWRQQEGRLVLSVVHDLSLARRFGTHALMLSDGRCVCAGSIRDVMNDSTINHVWGMDVRAWRDELHAAWK